MHLKITYYKALVSFNASYFYLCHLCIKIT